MARKSPKTPKAAQGKSKKWVARRNFEKKLEKLQVELCRLQQWTVHKGLRVVVVFEGRDAAGKGDVVKRITERVSPRVFRVVALPAPTEREKMQLSYRFVESLVRERLVRPGRGILSGNLVGAQCSQLAPSEAS